MASKYIKDLSENTNPDGTDAIEIDDGTNSEYVTLNNMFNGAPTTGDIIYFNGTKWVRLAASTDGYVLTATGAGAAPAWEAAAGGGLTTSIASVTTANVTGATGTHHILDVSGMTANRDFNLPTPTAAGQRCRVTLSTGDATYALIVKVNTVEVTRLFITNETLEFVSTGTGAGNWQLSDDGSIACMGIMERQTAQSINSGADTKIQTATIITNIGDVCDNATNYRVTVRRAGIYTLKAYAALAGAIDDQEGITAQIWINGVVNRYVQTFVSSAAADRQGTAEVVFEKSLAVGDYVELYVFHNEGAAVNTNTTSYPQLSVVELGKRGGSGASGGSSLSDGDYGDITVGSSGTTMTIDAQAVTLSKLVNATAQYKLLGRSSASAGSFEEITGSANVFSLLQAADYAAMLTLLFGVALPENTAIQLDAALSADGKYSGIVLPSQTAGTTLAFGDLCYLQTSDSRWELADADAEATCSNMLGMCVQAAAADGSATTILVFGKIRADANFPALTIGAPVYASTTAGDVQVTAPSGTLDIVRKVGHALTADELFFNPSNDYYEIA